MAATAIDITERRQSEEALVPDNVKVSRPGASLPAEACVQDQDLIREDCTGNVKECHPWTLFFFFLVTRHRKNAVKSKKAAEMGRCRIMSGLLREMIKVCWRESSSMGPKTKPMMKVTKLISSLRIK